MPLEVLVYHLCVRVLLDVGCITTCTEVVKEVLDPGLDTVGDISRGAMVLSSTLLATPYHTPRTPWRILPYHLNTMDVMLLLHYAYAY